jgi:hypothetical protein
MYEKSSSVTLGGYCLLPKGDSRAPLPPQKARPQPLIERAAESVTRRRLPARAEGGRESRCVALEKVEREFWAEAGREE